MGWPWTIYHISYIYIFIYYHIKLVVYPLYPWFSHSIPLYIYYIYKSPMILGSILTCYPLDPTCGTGARRRQDFRPELPAAFCMEGFQCLRFTKVPPDIFHVHSRNINQLDGYSHSYIYIIPPIHTYIYIITNSIILKPVIYSRLFFAYRVFKTNIWNETCFFWYIPVRLVGYYPTYVV